MIGGHGHVVDRDVSQRGVNLLCIVVVCVSQPQRICFRFLANYRVSVRSYMDGALTNSILDLHASSDL